MLCALLTRARVQATEEAEPTKDLLMPLLPFQKQWLGWSLKQETGPIRGGILADEMGMGAWPTRGPLWVFDCAVRVTTLQRVVMHGDGGDFHPRG